jgi:hypothetical protein
VKKGFDRDMWLLQRRVKCFVLVGALDLVLFHSRGHDVEVCKHLVPHFVFVEMRVPGQGHIYFGLVMKYILLAYRIINLDVFVELNEQVVKRGGADGPGRTIYRSWLKAVLAETFLMTKGLFFGRQDNKRFIVLHSFNIVPTQHNIKNISLGRCFGTRLLFRLLISKPLSLSCCCSILNGHTW